MFQPLSIYRVICPKTRFVWAQILVLHETDKDILIDKWYENLDPKTPDPPNMPTKQHLRGLGERKYFWINLGLY